MLNSAIVYRLRLFLLYTYTGKVNVYVRANYVISVIRCIDMYSCFLSVQCVQCISQSFVLYENG